VTFKPFPSPDRWQGLAAILAVILIDVLFIWLVFKRPVDGLSFLLGLWVLASLLALIYLGFRSVGIFTLQYWVDRDAVTLVWGPTRQIVPLGEIQCVQRNLAGRQHGQPKRWHWPCPHRRRFWCEGLGMVNSYATRPLEEQLVLVTSEESYGISPANPEAFLGALQARYALGVARPLRAELQRPPLWTWRLWRDSSALFLIATGLLAVLLMFGIFCFRLPTLSSDLPLHFDIDGLPDRIVPKTGLVVLPTIGLVTWSVNLIAGIWIYRKVQRQGAYLLWGGAVIVQIIAGFALFNVMRW
jgi:hypothetical protein